MKKVFLIERSPLARNIYFMLLSRIAEIELSLSDATEPAKHLESLASKADMVVISGSSISARKEDFLDLVKRVFKTPCLLLIRNNSSSDWREFAELEKVKLLDRPFFPEQFLEAVKGLWGTK